MKAAVKRYCKEGHDILTAQDMHTALKERPVRRTTADKFTTLKLKKIPNFSALHNFEFTLGAGKLIAWNDVIFCLQETTCLSEDKLFFVV